MRPLDGIDVLDFSQSIGGPVCTQALASLGASVIKVEPPDGDAFRPILDGSIFATVNRGKRAVSLDLSTDEGRAIAADLAADADVLVESFRPGVMGRFGLDYASVAAENGDVVYCSISGFGQDGPHAEYPAYEPVAQAMSGLMEITGERDGDPTRVGTSVVDYTTGFVSALHVVTGLLDREVGGDRGPADGAAFAPADGERAAGITGGSDGDGGDGSGSDPDPDPDPDPPGGGVHIDISLFDVATAWMGYWAAHYTGTGDAPRRSGNGLYGFAPYGVFRAGDGEPFYLATASGGLYRRLCRAIDREDLIDDDRFASRASRWEHRETLRAELESAFESYSSREIADLLAAEGIPAGPLQDVREIVDEDPHVDHREMLTETHNRHSDAVCRAVRLPLRFGEGPPPELSPPPALGADSRAVLRERGHDDDEIDRLVADGVVVE